MLANATYALVPVRASDAAGAPPPMWMCPLPHASPLTASVYLSAGQCPRCGTTMARITDALACAALDAARDEDARTRSRL